MKQSRLSEQFAVGFLFEANHETLAVKKRWRAEVPAGADDKSLNGGVIGVFRIFQPLHGLALGGEDRLRRAGQAKGFVSADGVFLCVDAGGNVNLVFRKKLLRSSAGGSTLTVVGPGNGFHFSKLPRYP